MLRNDNQSARILQPTHGPLIYMPDGSIASLNNNNGNGHATRTDLWPPHPLRHVDFQSFPDGTKLELVRNPSSSALRFLIWSGKSISFAEHFSHEGAEYLPPEIDGSILQQLRLPTIARDCGSPSDILDRLTNCLLDFVDLEEHYARLACTYALYTYVYEGYHVSPYMLITGTYASGKTALLRFLQCICRRALIVSDLSPAFLYSLPGRIRPTLMLDEYDTGPGRRARDIGRILRASSTSSAVVGRGPRAYDVFCPKILTLNDLPDDSALDSRSIHINLLPSCKRLRPLERQIADSISDRFQPELLMFRLRHLDQVRANCDLLLSSTRVTDSFRALSLPLLGDPELEQRLFAQLATDSEEASMERTFQAEAIVVRALMYVCHTNQGEISCNRLESFIQKAAAELGEEFSGGARKVGEILRTKLHMPTKRLGNWGRGFELTKPIRRHIHALAARFGLTRADILDWQTVKAGYGGPPCCFCDEFSLLVQQPGGRPLKTVRMPPPSQRSGSLFSS